MALIWQPGASVNPILGHSAREETLGSPVAPAAHSPAHQLPALLPRCPAARHALSGSSLRRGGGSSCIRAGAQRSGGRGDSTGPRGAHPPGGREPHPQSPGWVTALLCSSAPDRPASFASFPHPAEYLGFFGATSQESGSQRPLAPLCFVPLNSFYLP